jgi:hypothetical protein
VAPQQFTDAPDDQIVGPGVGVHAAGLAERRTDAVDEDDVSGGTGHGKPPVADYMTCPSCYPRVASRVAWV